MNHKQGLSMISLVALSVALAACGGATAPAPTAAPAAASTTREAPSATPVAQSAATVTQAVEPPAQSTQAPTATAAATAPIPSTITEAAPTTAPAEALGTAAAKLNLNTATGDQYLSAIPNFSNRMVREFLEYRPYISIQQFRREIGKYVDAAQVAAWEKYVYVPVNVDQSDAETLKQLPGVDDAIAAQLIAGRPYGSNEAFLAKLASVVSSAQATEARAYLQQ